MKDLVDRLRESQTQCRAVDRSGLLAEAADTIVALRQAERDVQAIIREAFVYAEQSGCYEGTLFLIAAKHGDPVKAAKAALRKFRR